MRATVWDVSQSKVHTTDMAPNSETEAWPSFHRFSISNRQITALIALLLFVSTLRGLDLPNPYSKAHWLFSYQYGLIKRGLIGTILQPVFDNVNAYYGSLVIIAVSFLILILFLYALFVVLHRISGVYLGRHSGVILCGLVFVSSPFMIFRSHTVGYFDNLLALLALLSVLAICRQRFWIASLLAVLAILIHEAYLLVGLPAVFFAYYVYEKSVKPSHDDQATPSTGAVDEANLWNQADFGDFLTATFNRRFLLFLLIPLIPFVAINVAMASTSDEQLQLLKEQILSYNIVQFQENKEMFVALDSSLVENVQFMLTVELAQQTFGSVLKELLTIGPALLFIFIVSVALLRLLRAPFYLYILFVGASLAPLFMHLFAWDFTRINTFTLLNAFLCFVAIALYQEGGAAVTAERHSGYFFAGIIVLMINFLGQPRYFSEGTIWDYPFGDISGRMSEHVALLNSRIPPEPCRELLFENSDFEEGSLRNWTLEGSAFQNQPTFGDNVVKRTNRIANHGGDFWIGTYENNPVEASARRDISGSIQGDEPVGSLVSTEFVIEQPVIRFMVGGGYYEDGTYIQVTAGGNEVARFSGQRDEMMAWVEVDVSAFVGQQAHIRIVDSVSESWGHINADEFCYSN